MENTELKANLFKEFSAELEEEGATTENTVVIEMQQMPPNPGKFARLLRKSGERFVTLVAKWVGLAFVLYVTWVQAVPEQTAIYIPTDHETQIAAPPHHNDLQHALHSLPGSGSAYCWVSAFASDRAISPPSGVAPYRPCAGDQINFLTGGMNPPIGYTLTITGSFAG